MVPAAPSDQENQQRRYDLVVGEKKAELAVTKYLAGELAGLTSIVFAAADAWFEEDEQTFLHPKDPYKVRTCMHYMCGTLSNIHVYSG